MDARTRTAVVEAAAVCGLGVLPDGRTAPLTATSRGLGRAVRHALAGGTDTVVLAPGGVLPIMPGSRRLARHLAAPGSSRAAPLRSPHAGCELPPATAGRCPLHQTPLADPA
ncbi:glycerate kinase [Streptomyces sp. NEAU-S77]|uniref:glycerate kinase n=1 Tax=Streptomyces sp. NEAU-S77 TaxID=3411033 RepID=UPI003BA0B2BA